MKRMTFNNDYDFLTMQYKEDDSELMKEGFIVADDYLSEASETMNND